MVLECLLTPSIQAGLEVRVDQENLAPSYLSRLSPESVLGADCAFGGSFAGSANIPHCLTINQHGNQAVQQLTCAWAYREEPSHLLSKEALLHLAADAKARSWMVPSSEPFSQ